MDSENVEHIHNEILSKAVKKNETIKFAANTCMGVINIILSDITQTKNDISPCSLFVDPMDAL